MRSKPTYGPRRVDVYEKDGVVWGSYTCRACMTNYVADQPLHWDKCTPDFCHECTKDLERVKAIFV